MPPPPLWGRGRRGGRAAASDTARRCSPGSGRRAARGAATCVRSSAGIAAAVAGDERGRRRGRGGGRARARSARQRSASGAGGQVGDAQGHDVGRVASPPQQHVADAALAGEQRLAPEQRRAARPGRRCSSPGNASANVPPPDQRGVDLRAGVVVVEHDARPRRPRAGGATASRASDRHEEREVRRALGGRQAQVHVDVAGVARRRTSRRSRAS